MKKVFITIFVVIIGLLGIGIVKSIKPNYSKYPFTDVRWINKEDESDTVNIRFNSDGKFSYFCGCGNPIENYDLCESYTYNVKTNTINLNCTNNVKDIIDTLQIISCTNKELKLKFGKEIIIFQNMEYLNK